MLTNNPRYRDLRPGVLVSTNSLFNLPKAATPTEATGTRRRGTGWAGEGIR